MRSIATATRTLSLTIALAACSHGGSGTPAAIGLLSQMPPPDAIDVDRAPAIEVTFTDDVDASSAATDQIQVRTAIGAVAGSTTVAGARQLRFVPTANLPFGAVVTARLRAGVRSQGGGTLAGDVEWRFRVLDPQFGSLSLPIADAGATRRAVVTAAPANAQFVVAVGSDIWTVLDAPVTVTGLPPQPVHETFPFTPTLTAGALDGALAGVTLVNRGSTSAPDMFLVMAVRHADGLWQNEDIGVQSGTSASLFQLEGGNNGAFVAQLLRLSSLSLRFAVGPRAAPPVLGLFDNPATATPTTVAAIDRDTAVVCQSAVLSTQPATFTRHDLSTNPPTPTATWQHAFGVLTTDRDGTLLVLSEDAGRLTLARLRSDGAALGTATVDEPPSMPLAIWRTLAGSGAAAAIAARFGACSSFRLDGSEAAPQVRTFPLDQDTIDTGAWDACYSPSGDLLVVARSRASTAAMGSLLLWRQRPGQDWESGEVVAELPGRPLGRPGIATDEAGLPMIAVPRGAPDEAVLIQGTTPTSIPAPR